MRIEMDLHIGLVADKTKREFLYELDIARDRLKFYKDNLKDIGESTKKEVERGIKRFELTINMSGTILKEIEIERQKAWN